MAGARDGDSEAKILAIALPFLRSKVLGGDHGGVLDADLEVPAFFAGVFRGEGEGLGLAFGFGEGLASNGAALGGGV